MVRVHAQDPARALHRASARVPELRAGAQRAGVDPREGQVAVAGGVDLEGQRRGLYAGAVGYFSHDGSMDTCIAIRTAVVQGNRVHVQAGAGVVWDSDPQKEHEECQRKARGVLAAIEMAEALSS